MIIPRRPSRGEFAAILAAHYERIDRELRILNLPRIFHPAPGGGKERVAPTSTEHDPLRGSIHPSNLEPYAADAEEPMALVVDTVVTAAGLIDPWRLVEAKARDLEGEWQDVMAPSP